MIFDSLKRWLLDPNDPERESFVPGRRSFLIMGGFALPGTMLGGKLLAATEGGLLVPVVDAKTLITPAWLLKEVAREFANSLKFVTKVETIASDGVRLGDTVSGAMMTSQFYSEIAPPSDPSVDINAYREQHVRPVAERLAARANAQGLNRFGDLALPQDGAEGWRVRSPNAGVSLRLVKQYDIYEDREMWRVDFIGGKA